MGLAPFFQKAALAGSHLLRDFEFDAFSRLLLAQTVRVAFDAEALRSREGLITLELTVNLLARLYPRLALTPIDSVESEELNRLMSLARSINPNIEFAKENYSATACIVVGSTPLTGKAPTIYVGSNNWITAFSHSSPVGSGDSDNPFGAAAAACFGVANVFRSTFADQLAGATSEENWRISLLDIDDRHELFNPPVEDVDMGECHLVGVGAIGNAAVWALARAPFLKGTLHLIDNEEVDDTNPQRYVLTGVADAGTSKVVLAQRALKASELEVYPHALSWGQYLQGRNNWHLDRVAVALDTPEDRRLVQTALPRWIVNAWTQPDDLGISRHGFGNSKACLMCLYMPEGTIPDLDDQIVRALNLPDDMETLQAVRRLLVTEEPIGMDWVKRIAAANAVEIERLTDLQNLPMRSFYQKAVCGGVLLSLGAIVGTAPRNTEVPMAFQSALAGILLATELVAHASGLKNDLTHVTTKLNLLRSLGCDLSLPAPQHPSGKCICQDEDYIKVYEDKYGEREQLSH